MNKEVNMRMVSQDEFWNVFNYNTDFRGRSVFGSVWYFVNVKARGERRQNENGIYSYWMEA